MFGKNWKIPKQKIFEFDTLDYWKKVNFFASGNGMYLLNLCKGKVFNPTLSNWCTLHSYTLLGISNSVRNSYSVKGAYFIFFQARTSNVYFLCMHNRWFKFSCRSFVQPRTKNSWSPLNFWIVCCSFSWSRKWLPSLNRGKRKWVCFPDLQP